MLVVLASIYVSIVSFPVLDYSIFLMQYKKNKVKIYFKTQENSQYYV